MVRPSMRELAFAQRRERDRLAAGRRHPPESLDRDPIEDDGVVGTPASPFRIRGLAKRDASPSVNGYLFQLTAGEKRHPLAVG